MSGIVHFKFKSSNSYDSVSFDGAFVSVGELKVLIADKKGLSKDATSELVLSDPRTQVEYGDDSAVIPKSSSVLVRRIPNLNPAPLQKKAQQPAVAAQAAEQPPADPPAQAAGQAAGGDDDFGGDLYTEQRDEDEALTQLLAQTGQAWEKEVKQGAVRGRGRGGFRGRGGYGGGRGREAPPPVLPKGYICFRCGQTGHHISECPGSQDPDAKRIRPAVGVPTALLAKSSEGGLLLPDGTTASLQPNEDAFLKEIGGMPATKPSEASKPEATEASKAATGAMVVASVGEPTLAGSSELGLPFEAGRLLMPPEAGGGAWDLSLPPPLPQLPLPGMGEQNAPLSREEFQRIQEQLRKKQGRDRSSSPSKPRRDERRRGRESRSPRRRDSPRRSHRSRRQRSRSSSSERRPARSRRISPMPSFIQLRKRSTSPRPRRRRASRSPSPPAVHRRRKPSSSPARHSPRQRTRRRDTTRWQAENEPSKMSPGKHSGRQGSPLSEEVRFDEDWQQTPETSRPPPAASEAASERTADLAIPELMVEPGSALPLYEAHRPDAVESLSRSKKGKTLGLSRLQRGVGSRWKAEEPRAEAGATGGAPTNESALTAGPEKAVEQMTRDAAVPHEENASQPGPSTTAAAQPEKVSILPKTFAIPLDEGREKKEKKAKRSKKEKRKHSKSSPKPEPGPGVGAAADAVGQSGLAAVGAYGSSATDDPSTTTSKLASSGGVALRLADSDASHEKQPSATVTTAAEGGVTTAGNEASRTRLSEVAAAEDSKGDQRDSGPAVESDPTSTDQKHRSHKHKEHKHKHSKKRHKYD